ncbi:3-dehydroquinate synthase family protein [Synechococcus sp. TAK9802]|nr:3-dehydroquinate synthase family protein [Synechococcus sp. TAK9802]
MGEVLKYVLLGCDQLIDYSNSRHNINYEEIVTYSLLTKQNFVKNDIKEQSMRLFLNFGHTIGHAIEFSTILNGHELLRHGEGVALGILASLRLCIQQGNSQLIKLYDYSYEFMLTHNLPVSISASTLGLTREELINKISALAFKDKKRVDSSLRFIGLESIGKPFIIYISDPDTISIALSELITD